jgi:hypothetical protein
MPTSAESVIPTDDGVFLLRDVSADTMEAMGAAFDAVRIPGRRGGHMFGAAGAVLLVRCAHQYSRPWIRVEVLDAPPADEPPWHWETRTTLAFPTGHIRIDTGTYKTPADLVDIDTGAGPGTYGLALGHTGRTEMQDAAQRVDEQTLHASADDTHAAWRELDGIERYLIRLWPDPHA